MLVCTATCVFPQSSSHDRALAEANLGVSLSHQNRYSEAIRAYQRAIALDPQLPSIYLNLGLAYFKSGDFRNAAAAFEKEDARAPNERVKTLLAMSFYGLGQYRRAAGLLEPLASTQPENSELSYLLAKCYLWSKQTDRAMQLFRTLLERDPNSPAGHMLLGEALDAERRTADAIPEFQAALKVNRSQPDAHFGLGYLYWELRDFENAEREFQAELKSNPMHARALAYLGDTELKTGNDQKAFISLQKAVALEKNLHIAQFDLAIIYEKRKEYDRAVARFKEAIRTDPQAFDAHYRLARLYKQLGKTKEAEAELATVRHLHQQKNEKPLMEVSGVH